MEWTEYKDFSLTGAMQEDPVEQYVQQLIAQGYPEDTARAYAAQYAAQAGLGGGAAAEDNNSLLLRKTQQWMLHTNNTTSSLSPKDMMNKQQLPMLNNMLQHTYNNKAR